MSQLIISVSGLRGVVGRGLDEAVAQQYAAAVADTLAEGPIIVTRDSRPSGASLARAVAAALADCGRVVLEGGIAATPTTGILVRQHHAAGGLQISASHNPAEYNGIKLFDAQGRVVSASVGAAVKRRFDELGAARASGRVVGTPATVAPVPLAATTSAHLSRVLDTVDVPRIRQRRFRVLVDSNHGAGGELAEPLLEALGVEAIWLGREPNGQFAHPPEPTAANLATVAAQTAALRVDAAFCQDPDADRLAIIDERGQYIGEEYTLVICLERALARRPGPVVINYATSRMSVDVAARHGCDCYLAAVGEANVCDEMIRRGAVYGGEGNGGPIDPAVGYVRDSFVGMAQVLDHLAATGQTISQCVARFPRYFIHKTHVAVAAASQAARLAEVRAQLEQKWGAAQVSTLDGLRLDWPDRWLIIRPSNTEPIVRIICEATTAAAASQTADAVKALIAGDDAA